MMLLPALSYNSSIGAVKLDGTVGCCAHEAILMANPSKETANVGLILIILAVLVCITLPSLRILTPEAGDLYEKTCLS